MTGRQQSAPDDPAFIFAELAAQAIAEDFPGGAKGKLRAHALVEATLHIRRYPDSQPETCWIVMRGQAPDMPEWSAASYQQKQAAGAFVGVLVTMDRAFRPAPKPKPPTPVPRMPGRSALRASPLGLTSPFKR